MSSLKANSVIILVVLMLISAAAYGDGWQRLDELESPLVPSSPLALDGISTLSVYASLALPLPEILRSDNLIYDGGMYAAALGVSYSLKETLKRTTGRTRPDGGVHSFPSGHATGAGTSLGFLLYMHFSREDYPPGYLYAAVPLQGMAAAGRVLSGNHYPTDVIAGLMIGTAAGFLIPMAADALFDR